MLFCVLLELRTGDPQGSKSLGRTWEFAGRLSKKRYHQRNYLTKHAFDVGVRTFILLGRPAHVEKPPLGTRSRRFHLPEF